MRYNYTVKYIKDGRVTFYVAWFTALNLMDSARMLAKLIKRLSDEGATEIEIPTQYYVVSGKDGPYWRMYETNRPRGYLIQKAPDHIKRKLRRKNLYAVYKREHKSEIQWLASSYEKAAQWVILNI